MIKEILRVLGIMFLAVAIFGLSDQARFAPHNGQYCLIQDGRIHLDDCK
jgi:hypothetical protein